MSNLSISKATDDVLKAYDIKWDRFNSSVLKDVYDSVRLKEGEMPDKDEFNSLLAIQYEKYLMKELRVERDKRLTDCDWTQNKDVVLSEEDLNVWKQYRQDLRDLPSKVDLKECVDMEALFPPVEPRIVISPPVIPVKEEEVKEEVKEEVAEEVKETEDNKEEEDKEEVKEEDKEEVAGEK
jgi:hypothetical protein